MPCRNRVFSDSDFKNEFVSVRPYWFVSVRSAKSMTAVNFTGAVPFCQDEVCNCREFQGSEPSKCATVVNFGGAVPFLRDEVCAVA